MSRYPSKKRPEFPECLPFIRHYGKLGAGIVPLALGVAWKLVYSALYFLEVNTRGNRHSSLTAVATFCEILLIDLWFALGYWEGVENYNRYLPSLLFSAIIPVICIVIGIMPYFNLCVYAVCFTLGYFCLEKWKQSGLL